MQNDIDLIQLCLQQDRTAQKALYLRYADMMMAVCYRFTKNNVDAEDVMQEGFVRVFRFLSQYRKEGELGAWIRKIMVHTALNQLKKQERHRKVDIVEDKYIPKQEITADAISTLEAKDLAAMIRTLPTGYQTVFNLYAIEGYSHLEIASMMGIAEGTSRSQYARARKILADAISKNHSQSEITGHAAK